MNYALAPNPIWWGIQGEGHLRGFQMAFLRLAGCSVGCPGCDTDYSIDARAPAGEIADRVNECIPVGAKDRWVWITGGEPADLGRNIRPLLGALRKKRLSIAVATSGHRRFIPPVDWLSVSPHDPTQLLQTYGDEIKLVDGLNGLNARSFVSDDLIRGYSYKYIQPLSIGGTECPESLERCKTFLDDHPDWALSRQDHHYWRVP